MFVGHELDLRDDVRPQSPKHPAGRDLASASHFQLGPPNLRGSPYRLVRCWLQRIPHDPPRRNRQFGSELPLIELLEAVTLAELVKIVWKSVVMDGDVQRSWCKFCRPVFRSQHQALSPRNHHLLGECALVAPHGAAEFEFSHWVVLRRTGHLLLGRRVCHHTGSAVAKSLITPARKFRILAHTNPTRQRGL